MLLVECRMSSALPDLSALLLQPGPKRTHWVQVPWAMMPKFSHIYYRQFEVPLAVAWQVRRRGRCVFFFCVHGITNQSLLHRKKTGQ